MGTGRTGYSEGGHSGGSPARKAGRSLTAIGHFSGHVAFAQQAFVLYSFTNFGYSRGAAVMTVSGRTPLEKAA